MNALHAQPFLSRTPCGSLWLEIAGVRCALTCAGALWLADSGTLVVGDLHLEKGSAYARRGQLLPPYDTPATLGRLEAEVARLGPRTLVLLGDSFHDPRALQRLSHADALRITALAQGCRLVWIEGNHDRRDGDSALTGLPGEVTPELTIADLTLRHEPTEGPAPGEVAGHLHPVARVASAQRSVRRRCFVTDGRRVILPAFGAYAGGLNLKDRAFATLFAHPPMAAVLGPEKVRMIPHAALAPD